jgi:hypothetical protein
MNSMIIHHAESKIHIILGIVVLVFFVLLAAYHVLDAKPYHILWSCHAACLLVGCGVLFRYPLLNGIGFLWLCYGVPLWIMNVLTGDELILLSVPTHLGGLLIGLWGVKRFGIPRFTWITASICLLILGIVCRFTTPPQANVNLSHAIWHGFETYFPSYLIYIVIVYTSSVVSFCIIELLARKIFKAHKGYCLKGKQ